MEKEKTEWLPAAAWNDSWEEKTGVDALADWLKKATRPLYWPPDRRQVRRELRDHVDERVEGLQNRGLSLGDARRETLKRMGDPAETGALLRQVHQPGLGWTQAFLRLVITTLLLIVMFALLFGVKYYSRFLSRTGVLQEFGLADETISYGGKETTIKYTAIAERPAVCDDEVEFGPFTVSCEDVIYRYRRKDWINSDDDITNSDFSLEAAVLLRFTAAPWYKLPQDFNGYVRIVDDNGVEYDALEGGALEAWNRRVLPWATVLCVEFRYGDWPEEVGRLDVYLGQGSAERKLSVRLEDWELRDLDVLPREDEADPAAWKERLDYAWYASWDAQTELGAFAGEESGGIRLSMPRATLNTYPEAPEGAGEPSWDEPWNIFHGQAASCLLLIQGDMGKQPLSTVALRDRLRIVNPELGPDAPAVPCAIYSVEICRDLSVWQVCWQTDAEAVRYELQYRPAPEDPAASLTLELKEEKKP